MRKHKSHAVGDLCKRGVTLRLAGAEASDHPRDAAATPPPGGAANDTASTDAARALAGDRAKTAHRRRRRRRRRRSWRCFRAQSCPTTRRTCRGRRARARRRRRPADRGSGGRDARRVSDAPGRRRRPAMDAAGWPRAASPTKPTRRGCRACFRPGRIASRTRTRRSPVAARLARRGARRRVEKRSTSSRAGWLGQHGSSAAASVVSELFLDGSSRPRGAPSRT